MTDGIHVFTALADQGGSPTPSSAPFTITLDTVAPVVSSINRQAPVTASTSATDLVFRVVFSAPVTGVDLSDFLLTTGGTAAGTLGSVTSVSSTTYDVAVTGLTGVGSVDAPVITSLAFEYRLPLRGRVVIEGNSALAFEYFVRLLPDAPLAFEYRIALEQATYLQREDGSDYEREDGTRIQREQT